MALIPWQSTGRLTGQFVLTLTVTKAVSCQEAEQPQPGSVARGAAGKLPTRDHMTLSKGSRDLNTKPRGVH